MLANQNVQRFLEITEYFRFFIFHARFLIKINLRRLHEVFRSIGEKISKKRFTHKEKSPSVRKYIGQKMNGANYELVSLAEM